MSILKKRYYCISKDNKAFAYIIVKKDFYAEGFIIDEGIVLSGYFFNYGQLNCFKLDNLTQEINSMPKSISFVPTIKSRSINLDGIIEYPQFDLYNSEMDEYCSTWLKDKYDSSYSINLIDNPEYIEKINYLIRKGISNLNEKNKNIYDYIKNHRYCNLKEQLRDISLSSFDEELITDLKDYLDILNSNKEQKTKKLRKRKK